MELSIKKLKKLDSNKKLLNDLFEAKILSEKKFKEEYEYETNLLDLQHELVKLQTWVEKNNKRVLIILEGRDTAGKGGTIKRFIEYLDPKMVKVVALPAPTKKEQGQWYFQRYLNNLPEAGQIKFFDRSWYNRAVVEPVFGFCTDEQHELFLSQVNNVEKMLIDDGVIMIKLFLTISQEEQADRLESRREDPLKAWKLGKLDEQAQEKWDDYTHYIEKLFKTTSTTFSPWIEVNTDSKKKARLECIKYVLSKVPYEGKSGKFDSNQDIFKIYT
ncbi:polyphosphate kinase [Flavobacteriaceae bacterium UJ101]|nr:polyphosphate kinase [Flavobacteriaceae bacterium UJ101]